MDDWENFNETTIPEKVEFYSNLNMEDITDAANMHGKRVCKDFGRTDVGEYHDLYLESDTLLLANVFQNFRKMCLKISFRSCKISFSPRISMASSFKKD